MKHIIDEYDYTKWKNFGDYYFDANSILKSIFSSTLYNLAFVSTKLGVIKEYVVDIKFKIENVTVLVLSKVNVRSELWYCSNLI